MTTRPYNPFSEWVARWNKPLRRFLGRQLPKRVDAEDLAQEVYLRLLRVEDLDAIKEPQAYLYRMARNIAAEWRARASENHPHVNEQLDELVELTTPETLAEEAIEARLLDDALRPLPATSRGVIYLKLRDDAAPVLRGHARVRSHRRIRALQHASHQNR